eukprot:2143211-Pyramimonas_sp.AAC.1
MSFGRSPKLRTRRRTRLMTDSCAVVGVCLPGARGSRRPPARAAANPLSAPIASRERRSRSSARAARRA